MFRIYFFILISFCFHNQIRAFKELLDALNTNDVELFNTALEHTVNDIYVYDERGNTILHHVCLKKDLNLYVIKLILDHERSNYWETEPLSEKTNNGGLTPLACAVLDFHPLYTLQEVAEAMQATGFDINYKNGQGDTLLHLFLKKYEDTLWCENETQMLLFLKKIGCSITAINKKGKTPLQVLQDENNRQLVTDLWNRKKIISSPQEKRPERKNFFLLCECALI